MSTVVALAQFLQDKVADGLGEWKVQLDPRGLLDFNPHTRVIDLVIPKIGGYDASRNILFIEAKF